MLDCLLKFVEIDLVAALEDEVVDHHDEDDTGSVDYSHLGAPVGGINHYAYGIGFFKEVCGKRGILNMKQIDLQIKTHQMSNVLN